MNENDRRCRSDEVCGSRLHCIRGRAGPSKVEAEVVRCPARDLKCRLKARDPGARFRIFGSKRDQEPQTPLSSGARCPRSKAETGDAGQEATSRTVACRPADDVRRLMGSPHAATGLAIRDALAGLDFDSFYEGEDVGNRGALSRDRPGTGRGARRPYAPYMNRLLAFRFAVPAYSADESTAESAPAGAGAALCESRSGAASRQLLALGPGSPSTPLRCVAGFRESAFTFGRSSLHCFPGRMQRSGMRPGTQRKTLPRSGAELISQRSPEAGAPSRLGGVPGAERGGLGHDPRPARGGAGGGRLRPANRRPPAGPSGTGRGAPAGATGAPGRGPPSSSRFVIVADVAHHRRVLPRHRRGFGASSSGSLRVIAGPASRRRRNGRIVPPCDGKSRRMLLANRPAGVIWRVPSFPSNPRRSAQSRASPRNSARGQPRRRQAGGPIGPPSGGALARSGHVLSETAGAGKGLRPRPGLIVQPA